MKKAVFLIFLTCGIRIIAQNPNLDYEAAIKVYNISTLQIIRPAAHIGFNNPPSYNLQVMHPALAAQRKIGKDNFHELELTRLLINKNYSAYDVGLPGGGWERGGSTTVTHIALRYEYILSFARKSDRKLVPSLGFGFAPSFFRHSFNPENTTQYDLSTTTLALEGQVTPRLNYHLNSRFFLDMNIPISAVGLDMTISRNTNPQIPERQQRLSSSDFSLLPSFYSVRLGLGIKF